MAADNEGGMVNRIGRFYEMKSAEYYGKAFLSAKNRKKVVAELGQEARKYHKKMASLGINLNLAPCLDTVRSYENKYGCIEKFGRSYGTHP